MSIKPQSNCCPKCGGHIPAEAPQGLCPKCLLMQAAIPTEAGGDEPQKSVPPTLEDLARAFPQLEILELIGKGGMGFVFKARQPKLDRFVAIKILPASLAADPAFAERFTREGRVLARLNHPNIVTIHDFGQAEGFFYLLMEFVDGVNLRQAMKTGRFTPAQALAIVPSICDALQFAHNDGILHRDIKPENILLDAKGRVKIADFGIAKLTARRMEALSPPGANVSATGSAGEASDVNLTETGKVLGTPHYMAPEQLEHPQDVDQRADIYSLGVVFYEMLTGELPIGRFAPPSEKSTADPRLDEVVLRTLEKERERRTPTAGEVKTQVETIGKSARGGYAGGDEPLIKSAKPRQDWWTWSPFQSPEVGEICVHLTKAERNHMSVLGLLIGVWIPGTIFGISFLIRSNLGTGKWILASVWLVLFLVSIPMWQRFMKHFLSTTTWARERGMKPEQLKIFSFGRSNLWKALAVLGVGLTVIFAQHKAVTSYLDLSKPVQQGQMQATQTPRRSVIPDLTVGSPVDKEVPQATEARHGPSDVIRETIRNELGRQLRETGAYYDHLEVTVVTNLDYAIPYAVRYQGLQGFKASDGTFLKESGQFMMEYSGAGQWQGTLGGKHFTVLVGSRDNIDLPFVHDAQVIGEWQSVDFIDKLADFNPETPNWKGQLHLPGLTFLEGGKGSPPAFTWTKGFVINKRDRTASRYEIRELNKSLYLLFEWKSGDVTITGLKPGYYVLKKKL